MTFKLFGDEMKDHDTSHQVLMKNLEPNKLHSWKHKPSIP